MQQLDNLKLYKPQLASTLEDSWVEAMNVVKGVSIRLAKRTDKLLDERDKKIAHLLAINRQL